MGGRSLSEALMNPNKAKEVDGILQFL